MMTWVVYNRRTGIVVKQFNTHWGAENWLLRQRRGECADLRIRAAFKHQAGAGQYVK